MLRLPPISLVTPSTLQEAVQALADGHTRLVAGGTDLWPNMKRRHQKADKVVSLMSIPGLDTIDSGGTDLRIGATATPGEHYSRYQSSRTISRLRACHCFDLFAAAAKYGHDRWQSVH